MKQGIKTFQKKKLSNEKITWITAYDYPTSYCAEQAGIDMILIGDSGGMVQLGYETTNPVTMDEMIQMAKAVRKGAPNTFIIGDMPQGSYEISDEDAIKNALRFVKEAGCDAIKLEGGERVASRVRSINNSGILVFGHLGLTPQSTSSFGGYRVQGKTIESFECTINDALALQEAGACAILLEAMPSEPASQVQKQIDIPIYGIGAGDGVDGQLIIMHDLLGFYKNFRPWFAKCYISDVLEEFSKYIHSIDDIRRVGREERKDGILVLTEMAIKKYINDVKECRYPGNEYSYSINPEELDILQKSRFWTR